MINPLKIGEMLSQANQMQEEVQRKLAADGGRGNQRRRGRDRDDERQEAVAQAAH
jgi:hypothetical protein